MSAQLTIKIPVWLDFIFTCPLLTYRLLRYGYAFRRIYLGEGEWTTVELADFYRLGHFKWRVEGNGKKIYAVRDVKTAPGLTKLLSLHREIMNQPKGFLVDHKIAIPSIIEKPISVWPRHRKICKTRKREKIPHHASSALVFIKDLKNGNPPFTLRVKK